MLKPPAPLADATSSLSDARLIRKRGGVVFIRPRLENISREMERRRKTPSSLLFRKLVRKLCSLNRANKIPYPILAARRDVDFKAFRKAVPSFFRNEAISTRRETRPDSRVARRASGIKSNKPVRSICVFVSSSRPARILTLTRKLLLTVLRYVNATIVSFFFFFSRSNFIRSADKFHYND